MQIFDLVCFHGWGLNTNIINPRFEGRLVFFGHHWLSSEKLREKKQKSCSTKHFV